MPAGAKAEIVIQAKNEATAALNQVASDVKNMASKSTGPVRGLTGEFGNLTASVVKAAAKIAAIGAAVIGAGLYALKKGLTDVTDVAASFESLGIRLETIQGSSRKAQESLAWIAQFTAKTPYELQQVSEAFVKLEAYGLSGVKWLPSLGDTASSMGKNLMDAVEMFADAMTGAFERLEEFGVKASVAGEQVTFRWSQQGKDMTVTAQKTASSISAALGKIFERFSGGMEKQSKTWVGMMSNLADWWTTFKKMIADSGMFEYLEDKLKAVLDWIEQLKTSGQLGQWAKEISDAVVSVSQQAIAKGRELSQWLIDNQSRIAEWKEYAITAFNLVVGSIKGVAGAIEALGKAIGFAAAKLVNFYEKYRGYIQNDYAAVAEGDLSGLTIPEISRINPVPDVLDDLTGIPERFTSELVIEAKLKSSPAVPFSEGIINLQNRLAQFAANVSNTNAALTIDASGAYATLDGLSSAVQTLYANQLGKVVSALSNLKSVERETSFYSPVYREMYSNQLRGQEAGLDYLNKLLFGTNSVQSTSKSSGMSVGDININLPAGVSAQTGTDWRNIVRQYIIPELRSAGAI